MTAKTSIAVILTGEEVKEIVKAAVREVLDEEPAPPKGDLTEAELAQSRKRLRAVLAGERLPRRERPRASKNRKRISVLVRRAVLKRDGMVCRLCGLAVEPQDLHLDHIRPAAHGGRASVRNLQVTHAVCNMRKGAQWPS